MSKAKSIVISASGTGRKLITTRGWQFLCRWKGGSKNWVALEDLKESYPVKVADFAISRNLQDEPAFSWWVPYVQKKRKAIISKVKSKYFTKHEKYGHRLPKTVKEALEIDKENNNHLWRDAINKEMKNARVAFKEHHGDIRDLSNYERITCHMIFDIKLAEGF